MAEIKLNIGHKGKNYIMSFENILEGKKLGEKVPGDFFGLDGYEFEITGGSDSSGFPMRKDIEGVGRKKPLGVKGTGFNVKRKGMRIRKTVVGNTVSSSTAQVNLKVVKEGSKKLDEILKKEEKVEEGKAVKEEKKEEPKKENKPKEESKPQETKVEEKSVEKKEEKK